MVGISCSGGKHLVGYLRVERWLACSKYVIRSARLAWVRRIPLIQLPGKANLFMVDMRDSNLAQYAGFVANLDAAPVGQPRYDEAGEVV